MYNLHGAILLSTGKTAKMRNKIGHTLIVSAIFARREVCWYVGVINTHNAGYWLDCGNKYQRAQHEILARGGDTDALVWYPVEMPIPDMKEAEYNPVVEECEVYLDDEGQGEHYEQVTH